ncbi:SDR family oxidoreductase [Amycolatopsis sp. YIM 10]|uniref:SDR family oxidoreductase n=1 Tax=Amycolatopsis sp. YIM 10 TaxID=2653857 RepID=UPI00128FD0AB|nr:SDR family oxidoreductase [Amycolatopsis sp. YIM 10]QFU88582.1 short chain dehydrogenase [Amycolatopsis sp. YIM 10]
MDRVVFGAAGFLGRWTVLHLLGRGRAVAAVVRRPGELRDWLVAHGAAVDRLTLLTGDLTKGPGLGLSPADDERLAGVRDVFNSAAVYRFGLRREEATPVNVDGAVNVLRWAKTRPNLRRLVHVSGYRVGLDPRPRYPIPEAELAALYREKGAYEGSKFEADAAVRVLAGELGIPLTVVNPSTVIGHSVTGEAGQYLGLAALVRDLWTGRLPVLPGSARTFVPVVTVDHFAEFTAALPEHDAIGRHWVLDENTPELPALVRLLAGHLGVRAPKLRVPAGAIRRLPTALTGADPETLTFLTGDRYDTASADRVARAAGLRHPPVETALRRWADRLVADGFGDTPAALPGGFQGVAGSRAYVAGARVTPDFVFLQGVEPSAEPWREVIAELGPAPVLVADLPGLGRSAPSDVTPRDWLADLLAPVETRPVLVVHPAAAGPAIRCAAAHPGRVAAVVVVPPEFVPAGSAAGPRRPGAARRTARWLRAANEPGEREAVRVLGESVPVRWMTGDASPAAVARECHLGAGVRRGGDPA